MLPSKGFFLLYSDKICILLNSVVYFSCMNILNKLRLKIRNRQGFTLVEALISMAIGLIVIESFGIMLSHGALMSKDNRSQIYADNALREQLEVVRRTNYDTLAGYSSPQTFTNAQITKLRSGAGSMTIASSFGNDIKKIMMTVTWRTKNNRLMTKSLTTYATRRGLNGS